jgi:hypothetical protein
LPPVEFGSIALPRRKIKNPTFSKEFNMGTVAEYDARVLAVIEEFAASKEFAAAFKKSQADMRAAMSGSGDANLADGLLEKAATTPFFISRNF